MLNPPPCCIAISSVFMCIVYCCTHEEAVLDVSLGGCVTAGLQGHPEFTDKYMEADLRERMETGNLPEDVGEAAIKELYENAVTDEHWKDMQKLLKTFLKVDHPSANVMI